VTSQRDVMRAATLTLLLVLSLGVPAAATPATPDGATITGVYPNPVVQDDAGEFVLLDIPETTADGPLTFTDGETTHQIPAGRSGGRIAIANHASAGNLTDAPLSVDPDLRLANSGERLRLERGGTAIVSRSYGSAPEGELARWQNGTVRWEPLGATDRPVVHGGSGRVRTFVLPGGEAVPLALVRGAERRLLLAGYTLTSERVTRALLNASDRGVEVRVLLEGSPIGGRTRRAARLLDTLAAAGVEVRLLGGPHDRYAYHHPKYAVADERAVVMTENWKPAGTGGNSSRGWGVVTNQTRIVTGLRGTFEADARWHDARSWSSVRSTQSFTREPVATGSYDATVPPETVPVNDTQLWVAPDNARPALLETVAAANSSLDIVQVRLGDWDSELMGAVRRAAARGVEVRVLLSSAWYVSEDNEAVVERLGDWADRTDAPLSARLAEPGGRYEKVHAKGAVVDDRQVVLGSLNWNQQAATENREVLLRLDGARAAAYFGGVFDADWKGGRPAVPVGLVVATLGIAIVTGLLARQLSFE
jgi:phosphatidylserine/phosphatidylglycerophosphate/cardiolipin synthase-like enzyme